MEFDDVIRLRRSTRAYTDEQITEEELRQILDAAQLAPIAGADYSMTHLTVVQDPQVMQAIREACMLHRRSDGAPIDPTRGVPTLIMVSATGPSDDLIEYCNVACAIENMTLAATNLGLGSCYLWGYLKKLRQHPEVIEKLQIPEGYMILSSLGVGYAADPLVAREPEPKLGVNRV